MNRMVTLFGGLLIVLGLICGGVVMINYYQWLWIHWGLLGWIGGTLLVVPLLLAGLLIGVADGYWVTFWYEVAAFALFYGGMALANRGSTSSEQ